MVTATEESTRQVTAAKVAMVSLVEAAVTVAMVVLPTRAAVVVTEATAMVWGRAVTVVTVELEPRPAVPAVMVEMAERLVETVALGDAVEMPDPEDVFFRHTLADVVATADLRIGPANRVTVVTVGTRQVLKVAMAVPVDPPLSLNLNHHRRERVEVATGAMANR